MGPQFLALAVEQTFLYYCSQPSQKVVFLAAFENKVAPLKRSNLCRDS
jgi:hypothetical protein